MLEVSIITRDQCCQLNGKIFIFLSMQINVCVVDIMEI
jgi:hypothetical protein